MESPYVVYYNRKAATALDEITKPLAEIIMDRAMEVILRKRGLLK